MKLQNGQSMLELFLCTYRENDSRLKQWSENREARAQLTLNKFFMKTFWYDSLWLWKLVMELLIKNCHPWKIIALLHIIVMTQKHLVWKQKEWSKSEWLSAGLNEGWIKGQSSECGPHWCPKGSVVGAMSCRLHSFCKVHSLESPGWNKITLHIRVGRDLLPSW